MPHRLYNPRPSRSVAPAALNALLDYQRQKPWLYLGELPRYLEEERDISVHHSTIAKALKGAEVSRKKGKRMGPQSQELRVAWQAFASQVKAELLVFSTSPCLSSRRCGDLWLMPLSVVLLGTMAI